LRRVFATLRLVIVFISVFLSDWVSHLLNLM
jgi:hypothetical protein